MLVDVGRPLTNYRTRWVGSSGDGSGGGGGRYGSSGEIGVVVEDRAFNLKQAIDASLLPPLPPPPLTSSSSANQPSTTIEGVGGVVGGGSVRSSSSDGLVSSPSSSLEGPVLRVDFDRLSDPNRCSIVFKQGATRNAERLNSSPTEEAHKE
jgi:hypothetical protein